MVAREAFQFDSISTADRLIGATVRAGVNPNIINNMMCGSAVNKTQAQPGAWIEFVCNPPTLAHFVSVDINNGYKVALQLCEVMVKEYIM